MRALFLLLFLTACCGPELVVYTRYDTPLRLASSYVQTPDPRQCDPNSQGETLVIHWLTPKKPGYWIELTRVFHCADRETEAFYLPNCAGRFEIPLRGRTYLDTGGYLSYQAILFYQGEPVAIATHPLFVEPIIFKKRAKEEIEEASEIKK